MNDGLREGRRAKLIRRVLKQNRMDFTQKREICFATHAAAARSVIVVASELVIVGVQWEDHNAAEIVFLYEVCFAFETSLVFVRNPLEAGWQERRARFRIVFDAHIEVALLEPAHLGVACKSQHAYTAVIFGGRTDSCVEGINESEGMTVSRQTDDDFWAIEAFRHPIIDWVIYI